MSFSIEGKTAIVTGAAHGVGLAIARHFVAEGANVVFADIDEAALVSEVGEAAAREGAVRMYAGDLRQKLHITNLIATTVDAFERIDILVNAARQMALSDPLNSDDKSVSDLIAQNMLSPLRISQAVARRMIKQAEGQDEGQAGSIINLSSIAAQRTLPELLAFSVSTAALDQMTRSLAVALAPHRIRVNAVACGSVMSESLRNTLREHEEYRAEIIENTPLHRIASPGEVADAAQYLACEASGFVTGQVITVDGGRTLRDAVGVAAH